MADAEAFRVGRERGVGMARDFLAEFFGVEFFPIRLSRLGSQTVFFRGFQVPVDGVPSNVEASGGLGFFTAALHEADNPLAQFKCISFHAR